MKKISGSLFIVVLLCSMISMRVFAFEKMEYSYTDYVQVIDRVNCENNTKLEIRDMDEFYDNVFNKMTPDEFYLVLQTGKVDDTNTYIMQEKKTNQGSYSIQA